MKYNLRELGLFGLGFGSAAFFYSLDFIAYNLGAGFPPFSGLSFFTLLSVAVPILIVAYSVYLVKIKR